MIPRYASGCVKLLLQVTAILYFLFATSCTKQCKPTSTEGDGSVIIRNVGVKLCQLICGESGQCLSIQYKGDTLSCRLLTAESMKTKTKEGHVSLARNPPDTASCSSKMCSVGQRCLKNGSGKSVCVQDTKQNYPDKSPQRQVDKEETFGNSSLHEACRKGNLTRVKHILSQGLAYINRRYGNHGRTPFMVEAREAHCRIVPFLLTNGANKSRVDNDGWNILHWACKGGHVGMVEYVLSLCGPDIDSNGRDGMTPLMTAVSFGHRDKCVLLVSMGANVSQFDYRGDNVLHWGCRKEHLGVVKYLLSLDSLDINSRGHKDWTPLMTAAFSGHQDVFVSLVRRGGEVSQVDNAGDNVLHWGCKGGHLGMVKYLLSLGSLDINSRGHEGWTPLMTAAFSGHQDVFVSLIAMGANVLQVDYRGDNVLHWGCKGGHLGVVKYLLSLDSLDINSRGHKDWTPLMTAAFSGHQDVFVLLVSRGCELSQVDNLGDNVLHWGCKGGHLGAVKYLLSLGSLDINSRGHNGWTPLMTAAFYGHKNVVVLLVRRGGEVSQVDNAGDNVLHWGCKGGHLGMVKYLLSLGSLDINCRGHEGWTPLMTAAFSGHQDVFVSLIAMGANVLQVDFRGDNVLHWGCKGGHLGVVKYLLSLDSLDINSRGHNGWTPLMTAAFSGHKDVFVFLVRMGGNVSQVDNLGENVLHWGCKGGHLGVVKYLLSLGSLDINSRGHEGWTPLMTAAFYGHKDVCFFLVRMGANVLQVDHLGYNALHWGCRMEHLGVVKYLLSLDSVDINSRGQDGRTPLMTAALYGHKNVFVLLVRKGGEVSQVDNAGDNVLHWGCKGGHLGIVKSLLSLGSLDINCRGQGGRTPLMTTAFYGHKNVFVSLVRKGANVSQVDNLGENVLHWGCKGGHLGVVKYLLSLGSLDINSKGEYGMTPLIIAAFYEHAEMVKHIISQNMVDIKARDKRGRTAAMVLKNARRNSDIYKFLVSRGCPVK